MAVNKNDATPILFSNLRFKLLFDSTLAFNAANAQMGLCCFNPLFYSTCQKFSEGNHWCPSSAEHLGTFLEQKWLKMNPARDTDFKDLYLLTLNPYFS